LDNIDYLSFSIFGFFYDYLNLVQGFYGEACTVDCVSPSNAYPHIGLLYRYEVVSSVSHHPHFESTLPEMPLKEGFAAYLPCVELFVFANDECFVFGRYPRKDLHSAVQKAFVLLNEIVVDGVEQTGFLSILKTLHFLQLFSEAALRVSAESLYFDGSVGLALCALKNGHLSVAWDHSRQNSGLDAKIDVVPCYDLSVYFVPREHFDGLLGIGLQKVHKGDYAYNPYAFQKLTAFELQNSPHFVLSDLPAAEGDAAVTLQRQLFNESVELMVLKLRVVVNHLRTALREDIEPALAVHQDRH